MDITEIETIVNKADIFAVSFRLFPERLLIDTRSQHPANGDGALPMVAIVDPVESVEERYFWLGQHRGTLGMPRNFMFFHWPHSIRYLDESGIWESVRSRIVASRCAGASETCADAFSDLLERERDATLEAIRGTRYQTLWTAVQT